MPTWAACPPAGCMATASHSDTLYHLCVKTPSMIPKKAQRDMTDLELIFPVRSDRVSWPSTYRNMVVIASTSRGFSPKALLYPTHASFGRLASTLPMPTIPRAMALGFWVTAWMPNRAAVLLIRRSTIRCERLRLCPKAGIVEAFQWCSDVTESRECPGAPAPEAAEAGRKGGGPPEGGRKADERGHATHKRRHTRETWGIAATLRL
mmetsp:Transcript_44641/g.111887  ORF Transcript_44641/g.111887 Transcript_44641/m.111887 type:complete len:207 (-) Transcript_44641:126-746(-)